jgi:hypothetical protein
MTLCKASRRRRHRAVTVASRNQTAESINQVVKHSSGRIVKEFRKRCMYNPGSAALGANSKAVFLLATQTR